MLRRELFEEAVIVLREVAEPWRRLRAVSRDLEVEEADELSFHEIAVDRPVPVATLELPAATRVLDDLRRPEERAAHAALTFDGDDARERVASRPRVDLLCVVAAVDRKPADHHRLAGVMRVRAREESVELRPR